MQELTKDEVRGLGHAVGLEIEDPELTTSFSLASSPALSMCCGFTSEHLPIGLQIGGKPFAEQTILNVAYAYQQATDWHRRRPPM